MKRRRCLNLHSKIDIFGGRIRLLDGARISQGSEAVGGTKHDRYVTRGARAGRIVGNGNIWEAAVMERPGDNCRRRGPTGSCGRLESQSKESFAHFEEHTERVGISFGDRDVDMPVLVEVRGRNASGGGSSGDRRIESCGKCAIAII